MKEFRLANPRVKLILTLFNTGEEIQSAVANGEADLGIGFDFTKDSNLKVLARAVGKLGAVMAPNHPLAKRASIRLERLHRLSARDRRQQQCDPALSRCRLHPRCA